MAERNGYMAGVPCWVDTFQPDPDAAADFYGALFGWETTPVGEPSSSMKYLMASLRGGDVAGISSLPPGAPQRACWNTYICVQSADQAAARARAAGGSVLSEPIDVSAAGRIAVLADREGAMFSVFEPGAHRGAQLVNEHGTLTFNGLSTRDLPGAREFYGALFGWEARSFTPGMQMWTLRGYGEDLERDNPGLRKLTAEHGVPGFEDVVAQISLIPADQRQLPANWSITFSVDDADAIAERARSLGGKVLAPPFDAPWVRMTILADPQGATFIASQFKPQRLKSDAEAVGAIGSTRQG